MWVSTMIASCASAWAASCAVVMDGTSASAAMMEEASRAWRMAVSRMLGWKGSSQPAAAGVRGLQQSAAKPITQGGGLAHLPDGEVGAHSRAQHAAIAQAERARRVDGGAAQRFFRRQPEMRADQLHRLPQRLQRR